MRKKTIVLGFSFMCLFLTANVVRADNLYSIDTYLETKYIKDMVVSAQGDLAVVKVRSYAGGKSFLYDYYLIRPDGAVTQLTTGGQGAGSYDISPDGTKLVYYGSSGDKSGLLVMPISGGAATLTKELPLDADFIKWTDGGIFFTAMVFPDCGADFSCTVNRLSEAKKGSSAKIYDYQQARLINFWRDGTYMNLFVTTESGGDILPVVVGAFDMPDFVYGDKDDYTVSADGNTVIFSAGVGVNEAMSPSQNLFETWRYTGGSFSPIRRITDNPAMDTQPLLSPDGSKLAYFHREPALAEMGKTTLHVMDRATGQEIILDRGGEAALTSMFWSLDGNKILFALDSEAYWPLRVVDVAQGAVYKSIAEHTFSNMFGVSKSHVWYTRESLTQPPTVYINSINGGAEQFVADFNPQLPFVKFGTVEEFHYQGPVDQDGETATIDAFLIMPPQYVPGTKVPLVINIHGGPEMAFWNAYFFPSRFNTMVLASMGFAVAMPNYRGSSGYGFKFQEKVLKYWGGIPYEDTMAMVDYLKTNYPDVDTDNACAIGGSYGGYMVNWIEARNTRFKCLVAGSSMSDLEAQYSSTDQPFYNDREMGGKPWEVPDNYTKWTPKSYVTNFKTPILVQLGGRDYRVSNDQGLNMFTMAKVMGVEARLVYFPDDGHSPGKPKNVKAFHEVIGEWLKKHLGI